MRVGTFINFGYITQKETLKDLIILMDARVHVNLQQMIMFGDIKNEAGNNSKI
jgi:hypothetical protein